MLSFPISRFNIQLQIQDNTRIACVKRMFRLRVGLPFWLDAIALHAGAYTLIPVDALWFPSAVYWLVRHYHNAVHIPIPKRIGFTPHYGNDQTKEGTAENPDPTRQDLPGRLAKIPAHPLDDGVLQRFALL